MTSCAPGDLTEIVLPIVYPSLTVWQFLAMRDSAPSHVADPILPATAADSLDISSVVDEFSTLHKDALDSCAESLHAVKTDPDKSNVDSGTPEPGPVHESGAKKTSSNSDLPETNRASSCMDVVDVLLDSSDHQVPGEKSQPESRLPESGLETAAGVDVLENNSITEGRFSTAGNNESEASTAACSETDTVKSVSDISAYVNGGRTTLTAPGLESENMPRRNADGESTANNNAGDESSSDQNGHSVGVCENGVLSNSNGNVDDEQLSSNGVLVTVDNGLKDISDKTNQNEIPDVTSVEDYLSKAINDVDSHSLSSRCVTAEAEKTPASPCESAKRTADEDSLHEDCSSSSSRSEKVSVAVSVNDQSLTVITLV